MLIESRIELGQNYFLQNKPVMRINENFNSTILQSLQKENVEAFRIISSKVPVVWTDVTNSMITVNNTGSDYADVKNSLTNDKALLKNTNRFGIMIYTDKNDIIQYVIAGSTAKNDTVYVSSEIEDLLETRYDILRAAKMTITDRFAINLGIFPRGTELDVDAGNESNSTVAEHILKILYTFVSYAHSNLRNSANRITYEESMSIDSDSVFDPDEFSTYEEAYKEFDRLARHNTGSAVNKNGELRYLGPATFNGKSEDWMKFRQGYRANKTAFDIFRYVNKSLLASILQLANIHVDLERSKKNKTYDANTINNAGISELEDIYNTYKDLQVRNSLLFNLSAKVQPGGDLPKSKDVTQFMQLFLVPDKIAHRYFIHQDVDPSTGSLSDIKDFDDTEFASGTPQERIDRFKDPEYIKDRRKNFDTGIRSRESRRYSYGYTPSERNDDNIEGNQGRAINAIQAARRARKRGMIATKQEINAELERYRRDLKLRAKQQEYGDYDYFERARRRRDNITADMVVTSPNDPTANTKAGQNPPSIKFSRIPKVKMRKIFSTFEDIYNSVSNNSISEFNSLLDSYAEYVDNGGQVNSLKTITNFYIYTVALTECLNDIVAYNTFGNMTDTQFIQIVYAVYNNYEKYHDCLFELIDAFESNNDTAVNTCLSTFIDITKISKDLLRQISENDEFEVERYKDATTMMFNPGRNSNIGKRIRR